MKQFASCGLILLVFCCYTPSVVSQTTISSQQAQDVLDNYAGVWDSQFTILPNSQSDQPKSIAGVVEAKRFAGGKFLEQTGSYRLSDESAPLVIKTIMSFDRKQQRYRYDYYISSGEIRQSTGHWDDSGKTMTSTFSDDEEGKQTTVVADFSKPDVEQWTIETRDRESQIVLRVKGTNTRRKTR